MSATLVNSVGLIPCATLSTILCLLHLSRPTNQQEQQHLDLQTALWSKFKLMFVAITWRHLTLRNYLVLVSLLSSTFGTVHTRYNDQINTSFCGKSYLDAEDNCSIETNCPSGQHKECGSGSYCWMLAAPECKAADMIGPIPKRTPRPTHSPTTRTDPPMRIPTEDPTAKPTSARPTPSPTRNPTEKPTESPIEDLDERNDFFCGTSYSDATKRCGVPCPRLTGERTMISMDVHEQHFRFS